MEIERKASSRPSAEAIEDERRRLRRLRILVDTTCALLYQLDESDLDGRRLVETTRRRVLGLFPGGEETFEMLYRPRFERILGERYGPKN